MTHYNPILDKYFAPPVAEGKYYNLATGRTITKTATNLKKYAFREEPPMAGTVAELAQYDAAMVRRREMEQTLAGIVEREQYYGRLLPYLPGLVGTIVELAPPVIRHLTGTAPFTVTALDRTAHGWRLDTKGPSYFRAELASTDYQPFLFAGYTRDIDLEPHVRALERQAWQRARPRLGHILSIVLPRDLVRYTLQAI